MNISYATLFVSTPRLSNVVREAWPIVCVVCKLKERLILMLEAELEHSGQVSLSTGAGLQFEQVASSSSLPSLG